MAKPNRTTSGHNFTMAKRKNDHSFHVNVLLMVQYEPDRSQAIIKIKFLDSFECSLPRKSLVKGERFFRIEREPELIEGSF